MARILGIGIPVAMFLLWWGIWGGRAEVESVSETKGEVLSCEGKTCLLRVVTGEQVRVLKARNLAVGMTVRVSRTVHKGGELRFDLITTPQAVPAQ